MSDAHPMLTRTDDDEVLTVAEAAALLNVLPATVRQLIATGEMDSTKVSGRHYLWRSACDFYRSPENMARKRAARKERAAARSCAQRDGLIQQRRVNEQLLREANEER